MQLLLTVSLIHLMACLSPGPDIFLVVLNSLRHGWRTGVATTAGILTGVSLQITLGIAGITYLVSQLAGIQTVLALAGGAWLAFLGARGLWPKPDKEDNRKNEIPSTVQPLNWMTAWNQGLLVNILNPKALLYFLSLFSVLLGPEVALSARIACGITMLGVQGLAFSSVALLMDRPQFKDRWLRLQTWLDRAISLVLLGLGIWIWITTLL